MKSLYTVDCWNSERILVPFDDSRTCAELQAEITRRIEADDTLRKCGHVVTGLRIRDRDGPRLFKDDVVADVIQPKAGHLVIYVVTEDAAAMPLAVSPACSSTAPPPSSNVVASQEVPFNASRVNSAGTPPVVPAESNKNEMRSEDAVTKHGDLRNENNNTALERNGSTTPPLKPHPSNLDPVLDDKRTCDTVKPSASTWYCDIDEVSKSESRRSQSHSSSCMGGDDDTHWYFGNGTEFSPEIRHHGANRVEWTVPNLKEKIEGFSKGCRIFSPEFIIYGMPLSLVFYPSGNTNAKPGFCSLGLKAQHGCHLRYKLFVGSTEKYTELRHNVTESWGFVDMYRIEDEIHAGLSRLSIGVEIISDIDKDEVIKVRANKVEWSLRNMKEKMKFYRKDVALYSQEFSLAGVDRLRIKFYPNGKKEADEEWSSLYLEAPKGSEIRVRLSVGRKSMSFDRIEKFGEDSIWGFLTLCKIVDEIENDEVKLGVEIMETKRLDSRLTESEDSYLKSLSPEERNHLLRELCRMEKLRNHDADVPSRFRILNLALPDAAKAIALQKWDSLQNDAMSGESTKLKKWIDGLLALPLGKIIRPIVSMVEGQNSVKTYLDRAKESLNSAVFGHEEPKEKILQLICQWISNPDSMSLVMGIQGPPGNGKTSLCRKGIAEALGRPFVQISLGGATDGAVLEGHSFTYVGSTWGRIAQMLMDTRSMNPVIFFDELDKVSETSRGEEIIGVLTHLTDHTQNKIFSDRYFEGIPLDLSKAMFIFSFNDESKINHVLKDRLTIINTEGFKFNQQLTIAQRYLLPELLQNVGMKEKDVVIERLEDLRFLCEYYGLKDAKGGVRGLKKALEACVLHINKRRLLELGDDGYKASGAVESVAKAAEETPCEECALPNVPVGAELTAEEVQRRSSGELEDVESGSAKNSDDNMDATTAAGSPDGKQPCPEWNNDSDDEPSLEGAKTEVQGVSTSDEKTFQNAVDKSDVAESGNVATTQSDAAVDRVAGTAGDATAAEEGEPAGNAKSQNAESAPKLPKFSLPLSLTKENIEWLLPRRAVRDDGYQMMYM